jgi:metal-responsive CopG/Arc/MetJ family transcriptional regulator
MKRVLVTLPERVIEIIQRDLKGKMGDNNSEVIRSIVIAYLSEKGYMSKEVKVGE